MPPKPFLILLAALGLYLTVGPPAVFTQLLMYWSRHSAYFVWLSGSTLKKKSLPSLMSLMPETVICSLIGVLLPILHPAPSHSLVIGFFPHSLVIGFFPHSLVIGFFPHSLARDDFFLHPAPLHCSLRGFFPHSLARLAFFA